VRFVRDVLEVTEPIEMIRDYLKLPTTWEDDYVVYEDVYHVASLTTVDSVHNFTMKAIVVKDLEVGTTIGNYDKTLSNLTIINSQKQE
jgi:hypothetical protein